LSGGIDSPVAGYFAMKRGVEIEAVHFASPPYTSEQALQKAKDLTKKLTPYVGGIQFIEVPFTEVQEEIKKHVPQGYWMTITRRMMLRLTDAIREARHGLIILNGESLGQVASQTLQSMVAINEVTNTPIIRPVATMDKLEIIDVAQEIDTFELAIQPFEDCCTIFAPPQPKTRPKLEKVHLYEERLDIAGMMERALAGLKIEEIQASEKAEFADFL
ncbi:MAG: tRNA sulfurtransferase, partial [Enterococcus gallinarum]